MFCSIEKLTLYMHKSIPECYNMINSKITLSIMAIFAASVLVTGALIATPSYASNGGHKDKDGVSGRRKHKPQIQEFKQANVYADLTQTMSRATAITFKRLD